MSLFLIVPAPVLPSKKESDTLPGEEGGKVLPSALTVCCLRAVIIVCPSRSGRCPPLAMQSYRHQASSGGERAGGEKSKAVTLYAREEDYAPVFSDLSWGYDLVMESWHISDVPPFPRHVVDNPPNLRVI